MWEPRRHTALWPPRLVTGLALPFFKLRDQTHFPAFKPMNISFSHNIKLQAILFLVRGFFPFRNSWRRFSLFSVSSFQIRHGLSLSAASYWTSFDCPTWHAVFSHSVTGPCHMSPFVHPIFIIFPASKSSLVAWFRTLSWSDFLSVLLQTPVLFLIVQDSVVGIATGYGLDDWEVGVRVPIGSRIFSSPRRPDRLWGPPILISNGYRWLFPQE
jgi:hypothetical protein